MILQRDVRYQAAIVRGDHVLLLKVVDRDSGETFWLFPGGGREEGEREEDCVRREVYEETHLEVAVVRFLFDEPDFPEGIYGRLRTYLCHVLGGQARPGVEPEVDTADHATIRALGWFDLRDPATWDALVLRDPITLPLLERLRAALGYAKGA